MRNINILFITILFFVLTARVSAQVSHESISTQYLNPQNINGVTDLQNKLEYEVNKVIQATAPNKYLIPFRTIYGEGVGTTGQYYWYHRYDTVYTLSLAYPYLSSNLKNSVKTYLQAYMSKYPLTNASYLPTSSSDGVYRNPDELSTSEFGTLRPEYSNRPKLFALYALWLYAQNTGDWSYIDNNWSSINSFYSTYKNEVNQQYSSIAGAIGYARMAAQKSSPDTSAYTSTLTDISNGLNAGKSFNTFATNAENAYKFSSGEREEYTQPNIYLGFQFLDITPEIGRYFYNNASLKSLVLGTSADEVYSIKNGETQFYTWYMAQAPVWTVYYGEGSGISPDTRAMIFPIKAWVQKEPVTKLKTYIDVPDAIIGDYYYIQNIVRTIEASGTECWTDINTNQTTCGAVVVSPTPSPTVTPTIIASPTPSPTATPTSTPTPVPTPIYDVNVDNSIDLQDVLAVVSDIFGEALSFDTDVNRDGLTNLVDIVVLIQRVLLNDTTPTPTPTPTVSVSPTPIPTTGSTTTLTLDISNDSDDVVEVNGVLGTTGLFLGTSDSPTNTYTGLRFTNVNIPQNATIQSAVLKVTSTSSQWLGISFDIYGDNVGNSSTFTSSLPSARSATLASASYSEDTQWLADTTYDIGDVSTILQEIVNRNDWNIGNSFSVILKNTSGNNWARKFIYDYQSDPAQSARLVVTYN